MRYGNNNTRYESYKKKVCFNCGDPNHISRNCTYKNEGIKCFRCEVFGHKTSECPDNNDTKLDVAHLIINKKETLTKKVLIDGLILNALIDSGSRVTLMRKSVYDKINQVQLFPLNTTLRGFSKKDGLHVKDDQETETASPVVKVPVELQHPSELPKLEDDLKRLEKPDPIIQCVTEEPDEYIVSDTEEFLLKNCLKDVKEDKACILLKKTELVAVVPESVPKEVKRHTHEKRRPRIKENKDYYFIPKRSRR
ncbi:elongation factor 2 [Trichonephila clavipes]|nr:elongation factor 2 [Trichonephila clavipes]